MRSYLRSQSLVEVDIWIVKFIQIKFELLVVSSARLHGNYFLFVLNAVLSINSFILCSLFFIFLTSNYKVFLGVISNCIPHTLKDILKFSLLTTTLLFIISHVILQMSVSSI